jgi:hypothetical protein
MGIMIGVIIRVIRVVHPGAAAKTEFDKDRLIPRPHTRTYPQDYVCVGSSGSF